MATSTIKMDNTFSEVTGITWNSTYVSTSDTNNRIKCYRSGNIIQLGGEFQAIAAMSQSEVIIATGVPRGINNTATQFVGEIVTQSKPIMLNVDASGRLKTYYGGAIAANDRVRFSALYAST